MIIRKTTLQDIDTLMLIYEAARQFMRETGNPDQWGTAHPAQALIERDITDGVSYVCLHDDAIVATFYFMCAEEPTYKTIAHGAWLNDKPYGVVHRIAARRGSGAGAFCLSWCFEQCPNIRIDTHRDNAVMQKVLSKLGYTYCGLIYLEDGAERIAFQKINAA
jgi:RimJ/RimL family protein N-acetyltransferase